MCSTDSLYLPGENEGADHTMCRNIVTLKMTGEVGESRTMDVSPYYPIDASIEKH